MLQFLLMMEACWSQENSSWLKKQLAINGSLWKGIDNISFRAYFFLYKLNFIHSAFECALIIQKNIWNFKMILSFTWTHPKVNWLSWNFNARIWRLIWNNLQPDEMKILYLSLSKEAQKFRKSSWISGITILKIIMNFSSIVLKSAKRV
jgi:hypothetical protein